MSQHELDKLDFSILTHLQADGRMLFKDMAKDLGVSSSTITNRYTKLVDEGYVRVHAYVDPYKVGLKTPAFVGVKVKAGCLEQVSEAVVQLPESDYVAIVAGKYDIDITLSCKDRNHLLEVLQKIHAIEGVVDTQTTMTLKVVKYLQASVASLSEGLE